MADEELLKSTVTPIKRASTHQKEKQAQEADINGRRLMAFDTVFNGREQVIHLDQDTGDVIIDGKVYNVDLEYDPDGYYVANVKDKHRYKIEYQSGDIYLEGRLIEFTYNPAVPKLERKKSARAGQNVITAPLPGNVTDIAVKLGDKVTMGQTVLTLEAMKMQNDIVSDTDGIIKEVYVKKGDLVSGDQRLILVDAPKEETKSSE